MKTSIPLQYLQPVKVTRVILHWTAGGYKASPVDKEHYHFIVEATGVVVKGDHDISDNVSTTDNDYAAHTRGCNTGSIGISMACMLGAKESPFDPGRFPMTELQWHAAMDAIAQLAAFYKIPVTSKTILTHAEVQPNLGIKQAGKWDLTRLPFAPDVKGAKACGDKMRSEVKGASRMTDRRIRERRTEAKASGEPGWKWRKALIFPLIIFACWRLMVMENAPDTMVNQTIAWGWVVMIISLAFFFTGFATAQDITAIMATRTGLPYANPPVAVDGEPVDDPEKDQRG